MQFFTVGLLFLASFNRFFVSGVAQIFQPSPILPVAYGPSSYDEYDEPATTSITVTQTITRFPLSCSVAPVVPQSPIIIMQSNSTLAVALPPAPTTSLIAIIPPPRMLNITITPKSTSVVVGSPTLTYPVTAQTGGASARLDKIFGGCRLAFGIFAAWVLYLSMV